MSNSTQVIVKFPADVRPIQVSFADVLLDAEVISSGVLGSVTPSGSLTANSVSHTDTTVQLSIQGGTDKQSYGVPVTINTTLGHVYTKIVAVVVNADLAISYQNQNDVAFNALVGKLEAGTAALGKGVFLFPPGFEANTGSVEWTLLDQSGAVYAQGTAFDYQYVNVQSGIRAEAQAVIGAPSDMVPTLDGQAYQIRWTLTVGGQSYHSFEQLEITGALTVPEGVEDVVELSGTETISLSVVTAQPYDTVTCEVYWRNTKLVGNLGAANAVKTANGWHYSILLNTHGLTGFDTSLEAYTVMWSMSNLARPDYIERQPGRLFLINPTLMAATADLRITLNKSCTSILGTADILFTVPLLLAYLRRGRDAFNGAYGMPTGFSMIAASGPIREYWLKFSEVLALRAQFLAEGEKAFNFSGQAISLDVDRTQFYDSAANSIQQMLDNDGKAFKQGLIKKGIIGGDGNVDDIQNVRPGAIGSVGITLSPATNWTRWSRLGGLGPSGGRVF